MHTTRRHRSRPAWAALALLAALGCSQALAAGKSTPADPKLRLQRDIAACAAVRSGDERANCLSEASTRFASTQPLPAEEHPDVLARNALKRCEMLPEADRNACVARMQGHATVIVSEPTR